MSTVPAERLAVRLILLDTGAVDLSEVTESRGAYCVFICAVTLKELNLHC